MTFEEVTKFTAAFQHSSTNVRLVQDETSVPSNIRYEGGSDVLALLHENDIIVSPKLLNPALRYSLFRGQNRLCLVAFPAPAFARWAGGGGDGWAVHFYKMQRL